MSADWFASIGCFGAALAISLVTSMTGVSGAFALVPFQISILGLSGPVVSSTNHLYNLIATPGGIARSLTEQRLDWRLVARLGSGTVPGALLGAWIRVRWLPDPEGFRLFAGLVLLVLGLRLITAGGRPVQSVRANHGEVGQERGSRRGEGGHREKQFGRWLVPFAMLVGVIGGTYGIGGGLLIAPVLVGAAGLSFNRIAGSLLAATFLTSLASLLAFQFLERAGATVASSPNWGLGLLFGLGGLLGTYLGGRLQRRFSQRVLRLILAASVLAVSARYLLQG